MRISNLLAFVWFLILFTSTVEAAVSDLRYFTFVFETANTEKAMAYSLKRAAARESAPDNSVEAEHAVLETLVKAMKLGVETDLVRQVFVKHRCIPAARNSEKYHVVAKLVDRLDFAVDCRVEENSNLLYVISTDGAVMYSGPSIEHERIGKIPSDALVRYVEKTDGWYVVEYSGITGYVALSRLSGYM